MIKGVTASITASVLFGALYYLAPWLTPLDGEQVFGWRVLSTLPVTTLLLLWTGQGGLVRELALRVWHKPWLALGLVASAALLGVQSWLFVWAPVHGRALPVSLGYFLLPLVMVLAGRVLYRESLSPLQLLATALAAAGVGYEIWSAGSMSWETWLVALGYTVYFVTRRQLRTEHLGGHWLDMLLIAPVAAWFVLRSPSTLPLLVDYAHLWALVPLMGMISGLALAFYMKAHRLLPLGLFGLLGYVEPVLLALVALLLGESISAEQWPTYGLIFVAVGVLVTDGALRLRRRATSYPPG